MAKNGLKKELGLFDVFAISTGAMFSSGFFLLPGIASQYTGPSVFLAYLLAGLLIMPAMFSIAEISTALPRAGGAYFFLDRSLGPMMGTIGGLGTYFALMFKTSFAIIGIGAYAAIFWNVPVKAIAMLATLVFMALNLFSAKKTSILQNIFVIVLIAVLGTFIIVGLYNMLFAEADVSTAVKPHFTPFFTGGVEGLIVTAGFVFVSYLGLTQITSVAEEIKNPERNIPLGMLLSLVVTGVIYVLGVLIMVAVIDPAQLPNEMTPAAAAAKILFGWLPGNVGLYLMTAAAMAAFASTGNAGLLATSRYPFAMGRDKLLPPLLARVGKNGTPVFAILLTTGFILLFILILSEEGIVKLASTFQLIVFILINFSVIVFHKSNIDSYDPGYRSPFYPYMQIIGIIVSLVLIIYMGWMPILFCAVTMVVCYLWYQYKVKENVQREGAIFHWFALLGKYQYAELENEFIHIIKEKGLRQGDPFDETIIRARVSTVEREISFDELLERVARSFSTEMNFNKDALIEEFLSTSAIDPMLVIPEVSILYAKHKNITHPSLQIAMTPNGINKVIKKGETVFEDNIKIFFFLLNPAKEPKQQLRMLSRIIDIVERGHFCKEMLLFKSEREIKEYLLQNERFVTVRLLPDTVQAELVGKQLKEIRLPTDVLVALIERGDETFTPNGNTPLNENDVLTIIGEPKSIAQLFDKYVSGKLRMQKRSKENKL
ncbi:MAG: amino acid permease [Cytophagaceae bacterium]|jgi:amino acid transporter/mannitol/fructose-specific phosphotransferase system IIA component (Ntr-type)|nr:amino acid permease [Cytophagaceae bacterium]